MRSRLKSRKNEPQASVFYISQVFSNVWSVLSQCNTRLRLLHSLHGRNNEVQNNKTCFFSVFYFDRTWVCDISEHVQGPIYINLSLSLCGWSTIIVRNYFGMLLTQNITLYLHNCPSKVENMFQVCPSVLLTIFKIFLVISCRL